jgi:hypothetical protein
MPDLSPRPPVPEVEPPRDDPHVAALRAAVAERLRPVCGAMTADEFDALVRDVVAFKVRWARD